MAVVTPDGAPVERGETPLKSPLPAAVSVANPGQDDDDEQARTVDFLSVCAPAAPVVTWVLLATIAVMFLMENLWGGATTTSTLVRMGAKVPPRILQGDGGACSRRLFCTRAGPTS